MIDLDCGFFRIVQPEATIRHWDDQRRCAALIRDDYDRSRELKLHSSFYPKNVADASEGGAVYDEIETEQHREEVQETREEETHEEVHEEETHEEVQETREEETHEKRRVEPSASCFFETKRRCCI